jgi:hypothetical protein
MTAIRPTISATILVTTFVSMIGCGELEGLPGTDISGTVQGESFSFVSGTADARASGGYILTLADDPSYDCFSTPPGNYLTIVVDGVDSTGSISALGNVSFNRIEDGINHSDSATSGSDTIDLLDTVDSRIEGDVDALGEESDVIGFFSVPIC